MSRKLLFTIPIFIVAFATIYFITTKRFFSIESSATVSAPSYGLYRRFGEVASIKNWWPGTVRKKNGEILFDYNGLEYSFKNRDQALLTAEVKGQKKDIVTLIYLLALNRDTTKLIWIGKAPFFLAKQLNRDFQVLLRKINSFYSRSENVYGSSISIRPVVDTAMIASYLYTKGYPDNVTVYRVIDRLKGFATKHGAIQIDYPMIYGHKISRDSVATEVALPLNKMLRSEGEINQKRLPPGRILETDITGGRCANEKALEEIHNYGSDHGYNMYVIPYCSLVTDRLQEPDSSRWVTKIYCPIFN